MGKWLPDKKLYIVVGTFFIVYGYSFKIDCDTLRKICLTYSFCIFIILFFSVASPLVAERFFHYSKLFMFAGIAVVVERALRVAHYRYLIK